MDTWEIASAFESMVFVEGTQRISELIWAAAMAQEDKPLEQIMADVTTDWLRARREA